MSDTVDELDLKIEALRNARRTQDYSSRMNELLLKRERAQEREFKRSIARRARLNGGTK